MHKTTIHGDSIQNRENLHDILKAKLELPEHYGANLDALWDCLTGWVDLPLELHWISFSATRRHLGEHANHLLTMLQRADREIDGFHLSIEE